MPTNVGAEYLAAEEKYLKAKSTEEKIKWLKEMIKTCPKHKGTEKLLAQLKKRLLKLEEELKKEKEKKTSKKSEFSVEKSGEALVSLVGLPNVGKSSLLKVLTEKEVLIADYPFTTTKPEIAVLDYDGSKVEIIDLPPILEGFSEERREIFGVIKNCDLVIIVFDLSEDVEMQFKIIIDEFENAKIKLGKETPNIKIKKRERGGLNIIGNLSKKEIEKIKEILKIKKIMNADVKINENVSYKEVEEFLNNFKFIKAIFVANKGDLKGSKNNFEKLKKLVDAFNKKNNSNIALIPISTELKKNIDLLKEKIWEELGLIRVFTKNPRKKDPDFPPITLKRGSNIRDLVEKIHEDFLKRFNYAKVYGKSVKFPGQRVGLDHKLEDKDVVEIYLK